ncbi:translation initiation factor 4G [Marchantia polymorpha subsp. ruderalis]|uniref:MI domain-containing protein n=1 Tax=Marchantia polymorpha TaxID=3197 RepID=A0A2R6W4L9_MARPO|nr:hypothetical protein MARPO_0154s0021 [Marchantia polymorpha]BBN20099.1 hypothetical protein Mp_8g16430 [Marchantia polymorpha subsp. ruderalis]|eukprot:PTQ28793.1 hypothetical protein MARPO_0154s0021 [Marchantia polymorpha]
MDATTTTLLPPTSSSSLASEASTTGGAETGPKEFVSLRPGGGGRFSFKFGPTTGGTPAAPSDHLAGSNAPRASQGYATAPAPVFPHRQDKQSRSSKPRQEVTRYSKEELLGYKDEWTTLPAQIAGSDVQRIGSSTMFEEFGRREQAYQPERTSEPDLRNWRERTPLPAPPPEREDRPRDRDQYRERPGPKENRERGPQNDRQSNAPQNRGPDPSPAAHSGPGPAIVKAASPWSARRGVQSEKEKVYKTVKGILNKLTPEKYNILLTQLIHSGISSAEILQEVISLVFDKAVLEPTFCSMYAQCCVDLSKALPEFPASEPGEKPVTFRRVLLNTCQSEFEGADALRDEIRQMVGPDQEMARAEKERNVKLRTLGNIKFIGELFKQKMIPEKIVHACIQDLLGPDPKSAPAEENVEALCQLLSTVGKELDSSAKFKPAVDSYFDRLRSLDSHPRLPSRIRFMVRDIMDVRSNKWVPRREEVKAKTINEIHAEAEQKLGLRAGSANRISRVGGVAPPGMMPGGLMPGMPGMPVMPGVGGRPGSMMPGGSFGIPGLDPEGWETVTSMRKSKREPIVAPSQGASGMPMNRSAISGLRSNIVNPRTLPQGTAGNSFLGRPSALLGSSAPSPAGPPSALRNGPGPADAGPRAAPSSLPAPEPAKVPEREPPAAAAAPSSQQVDKVAKKTESLLTEYFTIVDLKEALQCVKELGGAELHPQFVQITLSIVFEKRDKEQELVSKLFDYLHSEKVVSGDSFRAGVVLAAEQLEDFAMDAPLAPKLLGKILANLVASKAADGSLLIEVCKKVQDDEDLRRAVFTATSKALLSKANEEQTKAFVRSMSLDANLDVFGVSDRSGLHDFLEGEGLNALAAFL